MIFPYTIDQTKDCINDTEQRLRDVITTILSNKYGPDWEYSSFVWDDKTRDKFKETHQQDQGNRPYQIVSQRLIDYTNLLDLKNIIERHWDLFSSIFLSKETIMFRLDDLHTLRNPEMHGRPDILPSQKHLCLGTCGEILQAIEHWQSGYKYTAKEYMVELRLPVYIEAGNEEEAQNQTRKLSQQWLDNVCNKLEGKLRDLSTGDSEKMYALAFQHMHVKISMTFYYKGNDGRDFKAATITVRASQTSALQQVIEAGGYPYLILSWMLQGDLEISTVVSRITEHTRNKPISSSLVRANGLSVLNHAEFRVGDFEGASIRIMLSRWQPDTNARIGLVYDGPVNRGFYRAHEVFSIKSVLSILYEDTPYWKTKQMLTQACSSAN